jgi:hypothetical protein
MDHHTHSAVSTMPAAAKASIDSQPPWMDNHIHSVVSTMPAAAEMSIDSVARYVAAHERDPVQRIKALHDWVADRISYDVDAHKKGDAPIEDYDPEMVFRNRKGVCSGYAELLVRLGEVIGIPIGTEYGTPLMYDSVGNHAWNHVWIGDRMYELDATWDAGFVSNGRFVKRYSTQFLFVIEHDRHPDGASWAQSQARMSAQPSVVVRPSRAESRPTSWPTPMRDWVDEHRGIPVEIDWSGIGL